jgi:hypothetical protein
MVYHQVGKNGSLNKQFWKNSETAGSYMYIHEYIYIYKVKVKQSRYGPGVAQKVAGSSGSQIS